MISRKTVYALALTLLVGAIGVTFLDVTPEPALVQEARAESVEIQPFVKGTLASIVEARSGRPFLVVFWSTYCVVCRAEMPMWRDLRDERDDFDVVFVSTDSIEMSDKLAAILAEKGLGGVEAWAFADAIPARVRADVDKGWRGTLPYIHLYGSDGGVKAVTGRMHKDEVVAWLDMQAD